MSTQLGEGHITDLKNKKCYPIEINAEAIAARLINETIFIVGRSGTIQATLRDSVISGAVAEVAFNLYVNRPFSFGTTKDVVPLPINKADTEADRIWFVNDSLLMCEDAIYIYGCKGISRSKVKEVAFDLVKAGKLHFLGYGGAGYVLFENNAELLSSVIPVIGGNPERYSRQIGALFSEPGVYKLPNLAIWNSGSNERYYFTTIDNFTKATFSVLPK